MASNQDSSAQKTKEAVVSIPVGETVHHGIPKAVFLEDIPKVVEEHSAPMLIEKLSRLSQRYRLFEENLIKSRDSLEEKIAEGRRALKAVQCLAQRSSTSGENTKDIETHFELSDGIFAKARIPATNKVCLWLGANVMVEYTHDEATTLLSKNLANIQKSFDETNADISYLRDQLNTTDVNLSRVYNQHVQAMRNVGNKGRPTNSGKGLPLKAK